MLKRQPFTCLWLGLVLILAVSVAQANIVVNQVGYYAPATKRAAVWDSSSTTFEVRDAGSHNVVYTGTLSSAAFYDASGRDVKMADFSDFSAPGTYYIAVSGETDSSTFTIGSSVFQDVMNASIKVLYYNRASMALDSAYAGQWARPAGHDRSVYFHGSSDPQDSGIDVWDGTGDDYRADGGWYDAGDYGRYVRPANVAVRDLLALYELYPDLFSDNQWNIPESGNGVPDILDEVKYQLDWMLKMQDGYLTGNGDGGVYHKLTTATHAANDEMPDEDPDRMFFIGRDRHTTLGYAAAMARAARVWENLDGNTSGADDTFAQQCLTAAEDAWNWAYNDGNRFHVYDQDTVNNNHDPDIRTGAYDTSGSYADEHYWAAAELYVTTANTSLSTSVSHGDYKNYIENNYSDVVMHNSAGWSTTHNYSFYLLGLHPDASGFAHRADMRDEIVDEADDLLVTASGNNYHIPMTGQHEDVGGTGDFNWGSNGRASYRAMIFSYAYQVAKDDPGLDQDKYLTGANDIIDYLLGKNPKNMSFVSGFGDPGKRLMNPHHRPSENDGVSEPVPGWLAGGPNGNAVIDGEPQDQSAQYYPTNGYPALEYTDEYIAFRVNEMTIYWNAAMTFTLGVLDKNLGQPSSPTALDDHYSTPAETALTIAADGVLVNDTPGSGATQPLTASLDTDVAQGSLTLNSDGSFTYDPPGNHTGDVTFTYNAFDGNDVSNTATVTISVGSQFLVDEDFGTNPSDPNDVGFTGFMVDDTFTASGGDLEFINLPGFGTTEAFSAPADISNVGDQVTLGFRMRFINSPSTKTYNLRFGLFNTGGNDLLGNGNHFGRTDGWVGHFAQISTGGDTNFRFAKELGNLTDSPLMLDGGDIDGHDHHTNFGIDDTSWHDIELTFANADNGNLDTEVIVDGGSVGTGSTSALTNVFDAFALVVQDDTKGLRIDDVQVELISADVPDSFTDTDSDGMDDDWENANGLTVGTDDGSSDMDQDGLNNLLEYALNGDPGVYEPDVRPQVGTFTSGGLDYLTLTFRRRKNAPSAMNYIVEASSSLNSGWSEVSQVVESVDSGDGITETVTIRDNIAIDGNAPRFLRLRIEVQ